MPAIQVETEVSMRQLSVSEPDPRPGELMVVAKPASNILYPYHVPRPGYYSDLCVRNIEKRLVLRAYQFVPPLIYNIQECNLTHLSVVKEYSKPAEVDPAVGGMMSYHKVAEIKEELRVYRDRGDEGICLDTSRGFLITTAPQALMVIDGSDNLIFKITKEDDSSLSQVQLKAVAYDYQNDLVAATDTKKNSVLFINHMAKQVTLMFGSDHFSLPSGVAFMYTSTLTYVVVSDTGNHCVKVCTLSGRLVKVYGTHGSGHAQLKEPEGVCVDPNGKIIVADKMNKRVVCFWTEGSVDYWQCLLDAEELEDQWPMKVDMCAPLNTLIVITYNPKQLWPSNIQHNLRTFTGLADVMRAVPNILGTTDLRESGRQRPLSADGACAQQNADNEQRSTGEIVQERLCSLKVNPKAEISVVSHCQFNYDTNIIDMSFGPDFYVSILPQDKKYEGYSIVRYKLDVDKCLEKPKILTTTTKTKVTAEPLHLAQMDLPDLHNNHICYDTERYRVCVVLRQSILLLSRTNYKIKYVIENKNIRPYNFEYLKGIAYCKLETLYGVIDLGQKCIFLIDARTCLVVKRIAHNALSQPYSVAFRDVLGRRSILVSDNGDHTIKEFELRGTLTHVYGREGSGDGELYKPCVIVTDLKGKILVADSGNKRVVSYWNDGHQDYWQCLLDSTDLHGECPKSLAFHTLAHWAWLAVSSEITTGSGINDAILSRVQVFTGIQHVLDPEFQYQDVPIHLD